MRRSEMVKNVLAMIAVLGACTCLAGANADIARDHVRQLADGKVKDLKSCEAFVEDMNLLTCASGVAWAELRVGHARLDGPSGSCLALSDGETTAFVVLVGEEVPRGCDEAIQKGVAEGCGCGVGNVLVLGEKAFRRPTLEECRSALKADDAPIVDERIVNRIVEAACAAKEDLCPARMCGVPSELSVVDGVVDDGERIVRFVREKEDIELVNALDSSGFPLLTCRVAKMPRSAAPIAIGGDVVRVWTKTLRAEIRKNPTPEVPVTETDSRRVALLADAPQSVAFPLKAIFVGDGLGIAMLPGIPTAELSRRICRESCLKRTFIGVPADFGLGYLYDFGTWPDTSFPSLSTSFTQAAIRKAVVTMARACADVCRTCAGAAAAVGNMPAKWISGDSDAAECPAPVLCRKFHLSAMPRKVELSVAVAGWCEVSVNGKKIGSDVLSPVTCQPDRRLSSLTFDLTDALIVGENRLEVLLGNGWVNTFTLTSWGFPDAPWRGCPKICGTVRADDKVLFVTDDAWQAYDSPIVFNALRNGEWYDARLEGVEANLRSAAMVRYAPWGVVSTQDAVPCREGELFDPKRVFKTVDGRCIYDFGANIAGWCEIEVKGEAGAKVEIDYDESLSPTNTLLGYVAVYIRSHGEPRPVQHDEYTLAGRPEGERWHPRFTYHGFRYAQVTVTGRAEVTGIRSRFVHSDFSRIGSIETSDRTFASLQDATMRSYLSNFTGIPTDCPHREKNGWTGDAHLAMQTGLWNFDASPSYVHFLRMMLDAQRPNGAVPCIIPCTPQFGFGWGSGPAWDAYLFEAPMQIYRFTGDDGPAREAYEAMKRYLAFISEKADEDGLYDYGLKDYCSYKRRPSTGDRYTDTAYVYDFNRQMSFWAAHFGEREQAVHFRQVAERIKASFNRVFYRGGGVYECGSLTAQAAPLFFRGLCVEGEEMAVANRLSLTVRAGAHRAYFGILGAKWVPRALADHGYIDDAYRVFVQPDCPGWANWLASGDGTLHEMWSGQCSHNHIMFGDLSAWAYEYLGGIRIVEPGFKKVAFRPQFPKCLDSFAATHQTPVGQIRISWKRVDGKVDVDYSVPDGVEVIK